jgi:hypothetical protein
MDILKIIAFVLIAAGAFINYGAKLIVNRLKLADKMNASEAGEFSDEELEKYKMTKAIARVKVVGVLVMLPGVILIYIAFR